MNLESVLKILGWAMALTPVGAFLVVSLYLIIGAMNDDDSIKALVMLGLLITGLGAALLAVVYLTNLI